jgi:hypothetical protein
LEGLGRPVAGSRHGSRALRRGEVETSNSNQTPHLCEAVPQGINPIILILDLVLATSGNGNAVMGWKSVRLEKKLSRDHLASVNIRWERESIATCKVEVVH